MIYPNPQHDLFSLSSGLFFMIFSPFVIGCCCHLGWPEYFTPPRWTTWFLPSRRCELPCEFGRNSLLHPWWPLSLRLCRVISTAHVRFSMGLACEISLYQLTATNLRAHLSSLVFNDFLGLYLLQTGVSRCVSCGDFSMSDYPLYLRDVSSAQMGTFWTSVQSRSLWIYQMSVRFSVSSPPTSTYQLLRPLRFVRGCFPFYSLIRCCWCEDCIEGWQYLHVMLVLYFLIVIYISCISLTCIWLKPWDVHLLTFKVHH